VSQTSHSCHRRGGRWSLNGVRCFRSVATRSLSLSLACRGGLRDVWLRTVDALSVIVATIAKRGVTTLETIDLSFVRKACVTVAAIRRESAFLDLLSNELLLDVRSDGIQVITSHQNFEQGHKAVARRGTHVNQLDEFANLLSVLWIQANDRAQIVLRQQHLVLTRHAFNVIHGG
jgi:hypothetical protein